MDSSLTKFVRRRRRLMFGLALFWFINLLVGEWLVFEWVVWRCGVRFAERRATLGGDATSLVALIADPQLTDETSYSTFRRSSLLPIIEWSSDSYMRRSFAALERHVRPDSIVIAGDLMDGSRYVDDVAYQHGLRRYRHVFEQTAERASTVKKHYVSGNHDIGWGESNAPRQRAFVRKFERDFAPVNYRAKIGQFEWVFLASTLTTGGPTSDPALHSATIEFLEELHEDNNLQSNDDSSSESESESDSESSSKKSLSAASPLPRILVSHVPLYRDYETPCDSRFSPSRSLENGRGSDYINLIPIHVTELILDAVRPVTVFSGDWHHVCLMNHTALFDGKIVRIPEMTLGTFSWLQGNAFPSFSVAFQHGLKNDARLTIDVCYLPNQHLIYFLYILSLCISVALTIFGNRRKNVVEMKLKH